MNEKADKKITLPVPYIGLRPFSKNDVRYFFGRRKQTKKLIERLRENRFVAVIGESGSGKSSIVKAGLIPKLEAGLMVGKTKYWHIVEMRPGKKPLQSLANSLLESLYRQVEACSHLPNSAGFIESRIRHNPKKALSDLIGQLIPGSESAVLLVVDQFEEIFRFENEIHRGEAEKLVTILLAAVEQTRVPVYVVITMRSEFIGDCSKFEGLPEIISESPYVVPRLSRKALMEAIEGPATLVKCKVEPALVNRLCNEVSSTPDQLPIVQHLLMRLFLTRGNSNKLTMAEYVKVGGVNRALNNHVDKIYARYDTKKRETTERLFRCLTQKTIEGNRIRRPTAVGEILQLFEFDEDLLYEVITEFSENENSFLISDTNELSDESIVDITHESLIRNWDRLGTWVDNEVMLAHTYRRLGSEALIWDEKREALLAGIHLENAESWLSEKKQCGKITKAWCSRHWDEKWQELYGVSQDRDYSLLIDQFFNACRENELEKQKAKENEVKQKIEAAKAKIVAERAKVAAEQAKVVAEQEKVVADQEKVSQARLFQKVISGISLLMVVVTGYAIYEGIQAENERIKAVKEKNLSIAFSLSTHSEFITNIESKGESSQKGFGSLPLLMAAAAIRHLTLAPNWRESTGICDAIYTVLRNDDVIGFDVEKCKTNQGDEQSLRKKFKPMIDKICTRVSRNFSLREWYKYSGYDYRTYRPVCNNHLAGPYMLALEMLRRESADTDTIIDELERHKSKHAEYTSKYGPFHGAEGKVITWKWDSQEVYKRVHTVYQVWEKRHDNDKAKIKARNMLKDYLEKDEHKKYKLVAKYINDNWSFEEKNGEKIEQKNNEIDLQKRYDKFVKAVMKPLFPANEKDQTKKIDNLIKVVESSDWDNLGDDEKSRRGSKAKALANVCICGAAYDEPRAVLPACDQAVKLSGNTRSPYRRHRGIIRALNNDNEGADKDFNDHLKWLNNQPYTENLNRERVTTEQVMKKFDNFESSDRADFEIVGAQKEQIKLGCDASTWKEAKSK